MITSRFVECLDFTLQFNQFQSIFEISQTSTYATSLWHRPLTLAILGLMRLQRYVLVPAAELTRYRLSSTPTVTSQSALSYLDDTDFAKS